MAKVIDIFRSAFSTNGSRIVQTSEEFRKAKRNFLWVSGVLWLFSISIPSKGESYKVTLLSAFEVGQLPLVIGLVFLLIYNWMGFAREVRRAHHNASMAAKSFAANGELEGGTTVIQKFEQTTQEIIKTIEAWNGQLHLASSKVTDLEVGETEIGRTLPELGERLRKLESESIKIQQNVMAFFEATDGADRTYQVAQNHEDQAKALSKEIFKVSAECSHLASLATPRDREPDMALIHETENASILRIDQLTELSIDLQTVSKSFVKFADDMDGRDVRSHILQDRIIPYGFALFALVSCVWFKYEFVLFPIRNFFGD